MVIVPHLHMWLYGNWCGSVERYMPTSSPFFSELDFYELFFMLQMMWMGSGMTPMMFPGIQHYMSPMGMGVGHGPIPSPMQFQRVPLIDQSITSSLVPNRPPMCPAPIISPVNFQNQMQNASTAESYARYLGFHPIQAVPQVLIAVPFLLVIGFCCQKMVLIVFSIFIRQWIYLPMVLRECNKVRWWHHLIAAVDHAMEPRLTVLRMVIRVRI